MEVDERAEGLSGAVPGSVSLDADRRDMPRCVVDEEAELLLVGHGGWAHCRIVELSVTGCRMSTTEWLPAGIAHRVEAVFKVRGVSFRFIGVAEWTDGLNLVGIRFVEMPARRRDALAEVLCEVEAENAAAREKPAKEEWGREDKTSEELATYERAAEEWATEVRIAEERASEKPAQEQAEWLAELTAAGEPKIRNEVQAVEEQCVPVPLAAVEPEVQPAAMAGKPVMRERRMQSRHEVDTSAVIRLINVGSLLQGRIVDLSLSGCRIRTEERFPVGIYTRVETEFRLEGLPFRLGGVIQAVHDRDRLSVGIRFLDVSERKRAQVEQLIAEIEEMRVKKAQA
jgi:hypothetical protein